MSVCDKYQEMISALLDGELNETEQAEIREHIVSCDECREMYDAFAALSAAVSAECDVPEDLHEGIMARVHAADKATKTLGNLISIRRILTIAACFVVIVGTVFALRNNLFPKSKAADDSVLETEMAIQTFGTVSASASTSAGEVPAIAKQEDQTEYGGGGADNAFSAAGAVESEEAPSAAFAPVPAPESVQNDSMEGIAAEKYGVVMQAWCNGSAEGAASQTELLDVDALRDALLPQETDLLFDPEMRDCDLIITLLTDSGAERTLEIYFDSGRVWVRENGEVFLASCTQEEFETLR